VVSLVPCADLAHGCFGRFLMSIYTAKKFHGAGCWFVQGGIFGVFLHTPTTIRGVEFMTMGKIPVFVHYDWITLNVYTDYKTFLVAWRSELEIFLGELVANGRTAFYQGKYTALAGALVLSEPIEIDKEGRTFVTVTLPGKALSAVSADCLRRFIACLDRASLEWRCTRVDLAFDNCPFDPSEFHGRIISAVDGVGQCRTLAKRSSLKWFSAEFEKRDNGIVGTSGCTIGSRESTRFLRCYDKHGNTRLELMCRDDRANMVFRHCIYSADFVRAAVGHLLDYIDFPGWQEWGAMFDGARAHLTISNAREITSEKIEKWLYKQVAVALSVHQDISERGTLRLLAAGRAKKSREKYRSLLDDPNILLHDTCTNNYLDVPIELTHNL